MLTRSDRLCHWVCRLAQIRARSDPVPSIEIVAMLQQFHRKHRRQQFNASRPLPVPRCQEFPSNPAASRTHAEKGLTPSRMANWVRASPARYEVSRSGTSIRLLGHRALEVAGGPDLTLKPPRIPDPFRSRGWALLVLQVPSLMCRRVDAQSDLIPIHRHISSARTHFNWGVLKFKEAPEYCATLQTDC